METLYTIGYAGKPIDSFIKLLLAMDINAVCDVRSSPYSKQFPEYNCDSLKQFLKAKGINYLSFKDEFGARRPEDVYEYIQMPDGKSFEFVNFEKVYKLDIFQKGVDRVKNGIQKGFRICFLCSEKFPYDCHRSIMIGEYFHRLGYEVINIVDFADNVNLDDDIKKQFISVNNNICAMPQNDVHSALYTEYQKIRSSFDKTLEKGGYPRLDSEQLLLVPVDVPRTLSYWKDFFEKEYTDNIGVRCANIRIGYKKGTENDE